MVRSNKNMPERRYIAKGNFEEHNKRVLQEQEERQAQIDKGLRKGCECEYWTLQKLNLKTLQKIYTHTKDCPLYGKKQYVQK
jgi:hypothetical protein